MPYGQDDAAQKPQSLKADLTLRPDALEAAPVSYTHLEPVILVGDDDGEVPPVPIPNTEVKLTRAQDSSLETACENR